VLLLPSQLIEHELEGFGIRLNKKPPNITFKKKDKGGINFTTSVQVRRHGAYRFVDLFGGGGVLHIDI
jgi:ribosome-interacting GTPase 1